jgi:hypothetical protein
MKNLPYILLLSLFSHTLLWGQDDDFLKFRPLELVDTLHHLPPLEERNDFYEDDRLLVSKTNGADGVSLFLKKDKYWEEYEVAYYSSLYTFLDTTFLSSNNQFLMIQLKHSYRMHNDVEFLIIDLKAVEITSIEKYVSGTGLQADSLDNLIEYFSESDSKISFDGFCLTISTISFSNTEISNPVNGDIISKSTEFGYSIYDGEYHYINGNFVKVKTYINQHTFTNTAYDLGEKTYLTPECEFYFECDCCSEHLLFTSDSTFVVVAPCTQDVSVSQGKYEVIDNALHLHFSGIWQERYMVSDEPNKPTEYAYRTNTIPPHTAIFTPEICKNTTLFTEQNNPNHKLLRSQETLEQHLEYLRKVGLWK